MKKRQLHLALEIYIGTTGVARLLHAAINQTTVFFLSLRENVAKGNLIHTNLFTIGNVFSY